MSNSPASMKLMVIEVTVKCTRTENNRQIGLLVCMNKKLRLGNVKNKSAQHLMLLYVTHDERNESAVNYINEALSRGQLAVYATVHAKDDAHMNNISSKIINFEENRDQGNLLIVRLHSFYERALTGDLEPFEDLKAILEGILEERVTAGKKPEAVVVADCADTLSFSEKFDECILVERWWHNTHSEWLENSLMITVVCPHPSIVLEQKAFAHHKRQIARLHSLTLAAIAK